MNGNGKETRLFVFLCFASAVLFTFGSAQVPFLGSDEPRLAQIAKEMLQGREYIFPQMGGMPWLEKPAGIFWLMSGCYSLFGVSEFSARLPSALTGLLTLILIYATVSRLMDRKRALASILMVSTSLLIVVYSHAANCDMVLTCCITATLCSFLLYEEDHSRKFFLYTLYLSAALGVLDKGFVALILPGLAILSYLLIAGRIKEIFCMKPFVGLLILVAVPAIWFVPISLVAGKEFWYVYLVEQQFLRYTHGLREHHSPGAYFYMPITLLGAYPWTVTPFLSWKAARTPQARNVTRLALCWLLCTVAFFSLSRTKEASYILPAIPPFCILGALSLTDYIEKLTRPPLKLMLVLGLTNALVILAILWLSPRVGVRGPGIVVFAIAIAVLTALSLFLAVKQKFAWAASLYAMISFVGLGVFVYSVFPQIKWTESKMLSLAVRPRLSETRKLAVYNIPNYTPLYYTDGRIELTPEGYLYTLDNPRQLHRYLRLKKEACLLVDNVELEWMEREHSWEVLNVIRGRELSIIELRNRTAKPRNRAIPAS